MIHKKLCLRGAVIGLFVFIILMYVVGFDELSFRTYRRWFIDRSIRSLDVQYLSNRILNGSDLEKKYIIQQICRPDREWGYCLITVASLDESIKIRLSVLHYSRNMRSEWAVAIASIYEKDKNIIVSSYAKKLHRAN